ncbi:MAG: Do family serine endopeptidase, partial [Planctomycetota bacterium]
RPAVVSIRSVKRIKLQGSDDGPSIDGFRFWQGPGGDFFRRFFDQPQPRSPHRAPPALEQQGLGSGVIVSEDGYVLTNSHVAGDADRLSVQLHDGSTHVAKLVGKDDATDLAVIKIDASGLPVATFGDSTKLEPGQWVLALGAPFGLSDTLTVGVVSATRRGNVNLARFEDFIQTDAAINPGNSGGPLIDLEGKVVGINTAIASNSGGFQGVGFAIPSEMVRNVMQKLIAHGKVEHGMLGVIVQPLDQDLAASFDYRGTGVLVSEVMPDGPAKAAGIEAGDIITKFGDVPVASANELRNLVAMTDPHTRVDLVIVRKGEQKTIGVDLGELKRKDDTENAEHAPNAGGELGMELRSLTPDAAADLGLDQELRGALVESVNADGVAARSGIRANDVIVAVQDQPVRDAEECRAQIKKHDLDKGVRLLVQTGDTRHFLMLKRGA